MTFGGQRLGDGGGGCEYHREGSDRAERACWQTTWFIIAVPKQNEMGLSNSNINKCI